MNTSNSTRLKKIDAVYPVGNQKYVPEINGMDEPGKMLSEMKELFLLLLICKIHYGSNVSHRIFLIRLGTRMHI